MSRLSQLLQKARTQDPDLAEEIEWEVKHLQQRRSFGLNFERHTPESVELPGRKVRKGDKVRILAPRGDSPTRDNDLLWTVVGIDRDSGTASLEALDHETDPTTALLDDLVVTAEFTDPIYPGLVSTGKVERGGDKPFHTVINSENYHALETLLFTHQGKIDAIYIDPPYNTGAKDWKYNNNYVDNDDVYRHSKWLAFMERRLKLAKELLNPEDSVLVVTIDEREGHRTALLLEQTFSDARIQQVSSVINPKGVPKARDFSRVDEWIFFVMLGNAAPSRWSTDMLFSDGPNTTKNKVRYVNLKREGSNWQRALRPALFYPIFVDKEAGRVVEFGDSLPLEVDRTTVPDKPGCLTVWPLKGDGAEARWQQKQSSAQKLLMEGYLRSRLTRSGEGAIIEYLSSGIRKFVDTGELIITGNDANGALVVEPGTGGREIPKTIWRQSSHSATDHGSKLVTQFLGSRPFPFPKSLYAVEDTLRFFTADKPSAVILDFFSGSGTTAHAVMRLNKQDSGRRQSISVTNNEVSADEQKQLRTAGHRPGDPEWEELGICDHITKPRITAAITGKTPDGEPIKGDYKFTDEFPMADGFEENAEFFTLTYEAPSRVARNRDFSRIAPLLWFAAGAEGRRIEDVTAGWDVADTYGVLASLDHTQEFVDAMNAAETTRYAFVVTDDERSYQRIAEALPERVETVRLYEQYLKNFEILVARSAR